MDARAISQRLLYYKRRDIQEAITRGAAGREVAFRFSDKGFGARPDILAYPADVLQLMKKGVTSFHVSEERWYDPMQLSTSMRREDQDELRSGWDLVLDIDFPDWFFSRLTAHLLIKSLKHHGITSLSCKFSGNKGFHIGVPFEAFPEKVGDQDFRKWFPEGPRRIAQYLLDHIADKYVREDGEKIIFDNRYEFTIKELVEHLGIDPEKFIYRSRCRKCDHMMQKGALLEYEYLCPRCDKREKRKTLDKNAVCGCGFPLNVYEHPMSRCEKCGSSDIEESKKFNPFSLVQLDTLLISSRHLFRSVYSLHEKSGFASVPIIPETVLDFDKEAARPEKVQPAKLPVFLDSTRASSKEGAELVLLALEHTHKEAEGKTEHREMAAFTEAVPPELFPPCILKMLEGTEDGRKRSLFCMMNYLTCVGWNYEEIEKILISWNEKNHEPLREISIKSHIRYHKAKGKKILPPNCGSFYKDLGFCDPDALCIRIKNPVGYTRRKTVPKSGRERLTDEQKEMRRRHRENLKRQKESVGGDADKEERA